MWTTLAAVAQQGWPVALVALCVVSIFRGWLIPRSTHLREIGYMERENKAQAATIAELKDQLRILAGSQDRVGPVS